MNITLVTGASPLWSETITHLDARLRSQEASSLFPYHFLAATFPRLGGAVALVEEAGYAVGIGLLFPRGWDRGQSPHIPAYTLRYYALDPNKKIDSQALTQAISSQLNSALVVYYDPHAPQHYTPTATQIGAVTIGRPDADEAAEVPNLQQRVWGSTSELLYPGDIHSQEFSLATSLVARVEGKLAGFLFGFYKLGGPALPADWQTRFQGDLRVESQTLGVLPAYRGLRIGYLFKKVQAAEALRQGIGLIHWTVDPLQYANAALNFGLLRAASFHFWPDYYPFRNELNRTPASRFGITWLIDTTRVHAMPLLEAQAPVIHLAQQPAIVRVNQRWISHDLEVDASTIAIEIPADWTGLQGQNVEEALRWRTTTDQLFTHYLGSTPGKYVVTNVGIDGDQRFLIAEQATDALWARLGMQE